LPPALAVGQKSFINRALAKRNSLTKALSYCFIQLKLDANKYFDEGEMT